VNLIEKDTHILRDHHHHHHYHHHHHDDDWKHCGNQEAGKAASVQKE